MKVNEEALFWGTVAHALVIVNSHRPSGRYGIRGKANELAQAAYRAK